MNIPTDSIYFWMYEQGLKHIDIKEIETQCALAGKNIRKKDYENYWNGFHKSDLYHGAGKEDIFMLTKKSRPGFSWKNNYFEKDWDMYDAHPYIPYPEIQNRWVPCSKDNKPLIKWSQGCMTMADAVAYKDQVYLAENMKGTKMIVIDCDGDHGDQLDQETIMFLSRYTDKTHCIKRPGDLISFHLTFVSWRIIPTMHFPYAHIDIVGNQRNSLRYWKNKEWNGIPPTRMTFDIWKDIQRYIAYRKEKANA